MILITGAEGQLGTELQIRLQKKKRSFIALDIHDCNVTQEEQVRQAFNIHNPTCVINCAAYTNIDAAEDNLEDAEKVNIFAVKYISQCCGERKIPLIHISSDYVFDGLNYQPYREEDTPNPVSIYGKTKYLGEIQALEHNPLTLIIRTSWLYSSFGKNFYLTIKNLVQEKTSINIIYDQVGSPTYAGHLADALIEIIPQITRDNTGIYHFSNEGVSSWYDFAIAIGEKFHSDCQILPILTKDYPSKTVRPHYSILNKGKVKETFNLKIPHWTKGLYECEKNQ